MEEYQIKEDGGFKYIEEGQGETLILLHGLFGALSNFRDVLGHFSGKCKVVIPLLPIYQLPVKEVSVKALADHVHRFVEYKKYNKAVFLGNSLGGHVALIYALEHPERVKAMVLTGSSGMYENTLGASYPKRGDYQWVKEKAEYTFYDPRSATKELVDEVYKTIGNNECAIRLIAMSRSAMKQNLSKELEQIEVPVLLIWGKNDRITPPEVAEDFKRLLSRSELHYIDQCGHAPMMEQPEPFNAILESFLAKQAS